MLLIHPGGEHTDARCPPGHTSQILQWNSRQFWGGVWVPSGRSTGESQNQVLVSARDWFVLSPLVPDWWYVDGRLLSCRGTVIGPTFQFDVNKIRFGTVSYGFLNSMHCTLSNTALVPMTFSLRVPGDGLVDSPLSSEIGSTHSEAGSLIPREFEITPSRGRLDDGSYTVSYLSASSSTLTIAFRDPAAAEWYPHRDWFLLDNNQKVRLLSRCGRWRSWRRGPLYSYSSQVCLLQWILNADWSVCQFIQYEVMLVSRCIVPAITVMTPLIDYGRCFLRFPYERNVELRNESSLPARYELLPQQARA